MPLATTRFSRRPPEVSDWDEDESFRPYLEVDDITWKETGILDAQGNMLYWTPIPVGFGRMDEWPE